jgi:peroxiredoxin
MRSAEMLSLVLFLGFIGGCGNIMDDLVPSGIDRRPAVRTGTTGPSVEQYAPDFTLSSSFGDTLSLSSMLPTAGGVVLYFTMWCPVCDVHMNIMRSDVVPLFQNVRFFLVDYVSGSIAGARESQVSNGYDGPSFTVLSDGNQAVLGAYAATMGTTVVIDSSGMIRMNEDFKDGARLVAVLNGLTHVR